MFGRRIVTALRGLSLTGLLLAALSGTAHAADAEIRERAKITKEVQSLWHSKAFDTLEAMAASYRSTKARTRSGYPLLDVYYRAHADRRDWFPNSDFPSGEDWITIEKWIEAKPDSPTPIIIKALFLVKNSLKSIGVETAAKLTPWSVPPDLLAAARDLLEKNKAVAAQDPHWYTVMMWIRRAAARAGGSSSAGAFRGPGGTSIIFADSCGNVPTYGRCLGLRLPAH